MLSGFEGTGHSDNARRLVQQMTIGEIADVQQEWVRQEQLSSHELSIVQYLDTHIDPTQPLC